MARAGQGRGTNGFVDKLIAHRHPKSPVSEAYRLLRTNLQFSGLNGKLHRILVTSPGPEEGKSTTLANLAVTLAQAGHRVLIVDADCRKPTQHKIFGLPNLRGLTNLLAEGGNPLEVVQETPVPGLHLLSSGPIPPNPAELLGSGVMREALDRLSESFNFILVDSPPAVAVTDAALLAPLADGVILVIRAGETRQDLAREARAILEKAQAHLLGAVLNGVRPSGDDYRYYYYYGHSNSRDGGAD
ncbi:MAG: CpsD/CapB family tyrosine-protein kinase [Armatimonadota bacterium]|nr:CpsD/CapB family tyrosine-protein kinase [Armatimonadota bacterium]